MCVNIFSGHTAVGVLFCAVSGVSNMNGSAKRDTAHAARSAVEGRQREGKGFCGASARVEWGCGRREGTTRGARVGGPAATRVREGAGLTCDAGE